MSAPSADALAPLSAPHGVFAILGNHDDDTRMPAALAKNGVQVLKDARTHLTINGEGIELAGIRYWTRRPADIAAVVRGATSPVVLLAHDPRRLDRSRRAEHSAGVVGAYARRAGGAARSRRDCGAEVSRRGRSRPAGKNGDIRQPRCRNGVRPGENQLPA